METVQIIANLGTPADFSTGSCKRFLREFLGDACVLPLPAPFRQLLAAFIAGKRADSYSRNLLAMCSTPTNHPIKKYTKSLAAQIEKSSGVRTIAAFRYGEENLADAFKEADRLGAKTVKVLPLYPQNAYSTTQSILLRCRKLAKEYGIKLLFVKSYCDNKKYIQLLAENLGEVVKNCDAALVTFHSVPIKHLKYTDYDVECKTTFKLLAKSFGISNMKIAWQSKMGKGDWLEPSATQTVKELAQNGAKRIAVCCAGFPIDCTETLVEISKDLHNDFIKFGGESLRLAKAPNDSPRHAEILGEILEGTK